MQDLLTAAALVLVIEGMLWALFPFGMKRAMASAMEMDPAALRWGGFNFCRNRGHTCMAYPRLTERRLFAHRGIISRWGRAVNPPIRVKDCKTSGALGGS